MRPDRLGRPVVLALALALAACGSAPRRDDGGSSKPATSRQAASATNVQLGQGYLAQGKLELALEKLRRAIELDPKSTSAHTVLAVLYERIGDRERARENYRRAAELSPESGDALNNYGTFLCRDGDYDAADRMFTRALDDPFYKTPSVAYANRGSCALSASRLDVAEENLRRALQIDPGMPDALYALAQVNFAKGDYLRARAFVQRYESTPQASPDGLLLGYQIERKLGNVRAANEYRARLKEKFPDSEAASRLDDAEASR
jgi:type IV pilus assembly protein PilF